MIFKKIKKKEKVIKKVIIREGFHAIQYKTDNTFDVDDIIKTIKHYEDENAKMFECICQTLSENGHPFRPRYRSIKALENIRDLPDPYVNVKALFVDPKDDSYKFTISMCTNLKDMNYWYSKTDEEYVKEKIDRERKKAEEKRSGRPDEQ